MQLKKMIVAGAACGALAAAALPAASSASPSAPLAAAVHHFTSHVTPDKNVAVGRKLTLTSTHATPNTLYICALGVANLKTGSKYGDVGSATTVKSSKTGKVKCTVKFVKFHGADTSGTVRHCPLTKKDAKAGYRCGVTFADAGTFGNTSASFAVFTAKASKKA
jgi:hypothetical protein